ncbi:MAG: hypothetical protein WA996_16225, partial [Candidatus Promineifilaceae bacterium]
TDYWVAEFTMPSGKKRRKRSEQQQYIERATRRKAPATKSKESPGRKGVTTNLVSMNTARNRCAYVQTP